MRKPKGASYELIQQFEAFLNEKLKTKNLKLHVLVIPTERDKLLPHLVEGKGDIGRR